MKNVVAILSAMIIAIAFGSCTKYDPIYGVADIVEVPPIQFKKDMVYIHDNDVYLTDEILNEHKKLTSSPTVLKTHCVIASTHNKIAYLDNNGSPVVIDTSGNQLAHLTQYTNVKDINWYNGDQTLYILANNQVYFYGQSLSLPSPLFSAFPIDATVTYIDAMHIDEDLNVAYTYRYQKPYSQTSSWLRYYYGVAVNYRNGAVSDRDTEIYENFYDPSTSFYSTTAYKYYHKVKFCANSSQQRFLALGAISNTNENNGNAYGIRYWNYTTSSNAIGTVSTPLFSETYYDENPSGEMHANVYTLRKYLEALPQGVSANSGITNTIIYNFNNANNSYPSYFDWKP